MGVERGVGEGGGRGVEERLRVVLEHCVICMSQPATVAGVQVLRTALRQTASVDVIKK